MRYFLAGRQQSFETALHIGNFRLRRCSLASYCNHQANLQSCWSGQSKAHACKENRKNENLSRSSDAVCSRSELLKFDGVYLQTGVINVLNGVDFETPKSGVVSIIGRNGAGNKTILNTITDNLTATKGQIRLGANGIHNRAPYRALSNGIGHKLQIPSVFFQ